MWDYACQPYINIFDKLYGKCLSFNTHKSQWQNNRLQLFTGEISAHRILQPLELTMKILVICFFLLALGLASAAPRSLSLFSTLNTPWKGQSDEVTTSEVDIPQELIQAIAKAAPQVIAGVIKLLRYAVCDNTADSQLQAFTNNEERDAKIMALVKVMNDLLTAEEKLNEVKRLNMKGNLIAEVELFDGQWVDSVKSTLKSIYSKIGAATKKLLCK